MAVLVAVLVAGDRALLDTRGVRTSRGWLTWGRGGVEERRIASSAVVVVTVVTVRVHLHTE